MRDNSRRSGRAHRHVRVRRKISGSGQRPRLAVFRSNRHIYAQLIDDSKAATLAAASDAEVKASGRTEAAKQVGKLIAGRAKEAGVSQAIFDRGGHLYHGRVAAVADGAREGGLQI
jgi:large subunit ribosomal protein L18